MRGVIKLFNEKPAAVPFVHFFHYLCSPHKRLANKYVLAHPCPVCFAEFFCVILLACVPVVYRSSRTSHFCWRHCCLVQICHCYLFSEVRTVSEQFLVRLFASFVCAGMPPLPRGCHPHCFRWPRSFGHCFPCASW